MKKTVHLALATFWFASAASIAAAASRTVHLAVDNMTCAICPITVRKALERVPGVTQVEVSHERKEAVVTYDDAKTGVEALIRATTDAGYPARLRSE